MVRPSPGGGRPRSRRATRSSSAATLRARSLRGRGGLFSGLAVTRESLHEPHLHGQLPNLSSPPEARLWGRDHRVISHPDAR